MSGAAVLRDAAWLNGSRARAYALILIVLLAAAGAAVVKGRYDAARNDVSGRPPATDFIPFYASGRLAMSGHAADAYSLDRLGRAERANVAATSELPFLYPPPLLLLCAAIGALPLGLAWIVFEVIGLVPFLFLLRRLLPPDWPFLPVAAAPAIWMNLGSGQTGFLTAASFAGGAVWLDRRPLLGGACLGFLVVKPHLAVLVPVALFAARRWRAAAACAVTAGCLCTLSWIVFGTAVWLAFIAQAPLARDMMETWRQSFRLLVSAYGVVRMLGGGVTFGYAAQGACALAATALLVWRCTGRPGARAEVALLTAAALMATPYLMDYDLTCLAVPALFIARQASPRSWLPWEKVTLAILYILPLVARAAQLALGVPLALPVAAMLLLLVARRTGAEA